MAEKLNTELVQNAIRKFSDGLEFAVCFPVGSDWDVFLCQKKPGALEQLLAAISSLEPRPTGFANWNCQYSIVGQDDAKNGPLLHLVAWQSATIAECTEPGLLLKKVAHCGRPLLGESPVLSRWQRIEIKLEEHLEIYLQKAFDLLVLGRLGPRTESTCFELKSKIRYLARHAVEVLLHNRFGVNLDEFQCRSGTIEAARRCNAIPSDVIRMIDLALDRTLDHDDLVSAAGRLHRWIQEQARCLEVMGTRRIE